MPAWKATDFSSAEVIGSDSRTITGGGGRLRGLLVVGEVATAVLLLFGAGLLLRTLVAVEAFDRGYRADSVLSMLVDPLGSKYPTPESLQQFYDQVEAEIARCPGCRERRLGERAAARLLRFGRSSRSRSSAIRRSTRASGRATEYQVVSPTYFSTLDLPIVAGRAFDRARYARRRARLHRQRGVRAQFSRPIADRPAGRVAAGGLAAGEARRCARSSASRDR